MLEEEKRVSTRVSNGVVSFDTQRVVDRLREGGWNEGQTRALCDVLREIKRGVAMSAELERVESSLRADNKRLESSMEGQMVSLRADNKRLESSMEGQMVSLRADNKRLESSLEGKFASLEGQIASLRFMMLAGFGFLGLAMTFVGIFVAF